MNIIVTWTRKGRCDRRKCQAACCRALNLGTGSFENDMGVTPGDMNINYADHSCANINELSASFDCKIYRNRPNLCREFPASPWDSIYQQVRARCTFWFEIEIKELPDPSPVSPLAEAGSNDLKPTHNQEE